MGSDLPGPGGGFAMVLALGLPLSAAAAIVLGTRSWRTVPMMAAVFGATVVSLLLAWWLLWPALHWLSSHLQQWP